MQCCEHLRHITIATWRRMPRYHLEGRSSGTVTLEQRTGALPP